MQLCSHCNTRVAVVFVTRIEKDRTVNEGYCLPCARKLGIRPVNEMLGKVGISGEELDKITEGLDMAIQEAADKGAIDGNGETGPIPIDLSKLFRNMNFSAMPDGADARVGEKGKTDGQRKEKNKKFLSAYGRNLTAAAAEGKLDRIVGRDRELERVIQILCRRQKNNPCLVGEPGVGKTAIAEALAIRITEANVPYRLRDKEIWLLDLTALVAGTQFRGQFESRVLGLISEVKEAGNIILVIDEVHNIVGTGESEGSMNAANILKPALSRGEIQVIGATTLKEYRKYIEKDSALERRFQPVMITEPSVRETAEMLLAIRGYYEKFHGVHLPDATLRAAAAMAERYITDRFLPDKAIDLVDEAAARLSLDSPELNRRRQLDAELASIAREKAAAEAIPDAEEPEKNEEKYKTIADLTVRELKLKEELEPLIPICDALSVTIDDLAAVVETWTGIPATSIDRSEFRQLDELQSVIEKKIIGQSEAVSAVVRAIKRKRAGVSARQAPVSFIFAGPTGVGKTALVKVLAGELFHQPETLIRLDMSEYMEKHSVSRIIGAPPGYIGFDEAGQLTEKIRRRPYSVILFDEIEKAHPDVLNILLQVLDEGKLTDATGRLVNFENTVIVMTTNAGSERTASVSGFTGTTEEVSREKTERALSSFLRPEFINRVDEIITFRSLSREDFARIADLMLQETKDALAARGINFTWKPEAGRLIADRSYSEKFGARNMRRYIESHVEDALAEQIISRYGEKVTEAGLSIGDDGELRINVL